MRGLEGRLEGKVALVTGAARGTGAVTARVLVEQGAKVLLVDVLDERGTRVAAELGEAAAYAHLDVTREDDWERGIEEVERRFGCLTTLVNNAAVLLVAPIEQTSVEDYQRITQVNELGTFLGIRSAVEPLKRAGGGSIINIASIDGYFVSAGTAAYAASKFAVRGLTKVAALELGRHGIRVNVINPGMGNPEMIEPFLPPGIDMEAVRKAHPPSPVGRRGTMEDVAHAVAFLASDESGYFHGADFDLDGGTSAGMIIPGPTPGRRRR
jgi:3alpha(or 20beta)-hydroxysteroid dehydrogenase